MKEIYHTVNRLQSFQSWNNGKSGGKLDLTSWTKPGLQIHKFDHTRTANLCDWLPCRRAALLLVRCSHSLLYLYLPVVEGLIFCISATPHLGTSFPLFHGFHWVPGILRVSLFCLPDVTLSAACTVREAWAEGGWSFKLFSYKFQSWILLVLT